MLLLAIALLAPVRLQSQGTEARLRHRLASLATREAGLVAAAAARDSAAWQREGFVPVGRGPVVVLAPGWSGPAAAPMVTALADSWTVRAGTVFTGAPAETLRVAVRGDTADWSRHEIRTMLADFPLEVVGRAQRGVQERVGRRVGSRLLRWSGSPLFLTNGALTRRAAILVLARDTTGRGPGCLAGELRDCLTALARDTRTIGAVRRSLLAYTLERAGPAGWELLARDTLGAPETRIGEVDGRGYETAVEAWLADLRAPSPSDPRDPWLVPVTIGWSLALVALFLWRLTWHRA